MADATRPYADPSHPGNGAKYHTGHKCIERGCSEPAGTAWGRYWCWRHNTERIDRITAKLEDLAEQPWLTH